jgi:hypothetical protein
MVMRWKRRSVIVAACIVVPISLVGGCWIIEDVQIRTFYRKHELVNAMNHATQGIDPWKTDPGALRRKVLLGRVPLGTTQAETIRVLSSEGFACQQWNASPPRSNVAFDCYLAAEPPTNVGRWLIQLDFNNEKRLANADIRILK